MKSTVAQKICSGHDQFHDMYISSRHFVPQKCEPGGSCAELTISPPIFTQFSPVIPHAESFMAETHVSFVEAVPDRPGAHPWSILDRSGGSAIVWAGARSGLLRMNRGSVLIRFYGTLERHEFIVKPGVHRSYISVFYNWGIEKLSYCTRFPHRRSGSM